MKVNTDLAEALLMLSVISLVLIGTTEFQNEMEKIYLMVGLGVSAVISLIFRIIGAKQRATRQSE